MVKACISSTNFICPYTFLDAAALHEVGIFRLPGQASRVQDLKDLYDQGGLCKGWCLARSSAMSRLPAAVLCL